MNAVGIEVRPYTETSALADILEWSRQRPEWLRDALRRLIAGGELSEEDIDELEEICLGNGGEGSPLAAQHVVPQRLAGKPVAITGLRRSGGCECAGERTEPDLRCERSDDRLWRQRIREIGLCTRSQARVSLAGRKDGHLAGRERRGPNPAIRPYRFRGRPAGPRHTIGARSMAIMQICRRSAFSMPAAPTPMCRRRTPSPTYRSRWRCSIGWEGSAMNCGAA